MVQFTFATLGPLLRATGRRQRSLTDVPTRKAQVSLFNPLADKSDERPCSHCGAVMTPRLAKEGRRWECPCCHNELHEVVGGDDPESGWLVSTETGSRELITEKQRQFLVDLGEIDLPRFKSEASQRLDKILGPFKAWMGECFINAQALQRPEERRLQIDLNAGGWLERLPRTVSAWDEQQRLSFLSMVKEVLGAELFLELRPKGMTKYGEALGFPERQRKAKDISFACESCGQTYAAPEELAGTSLNCHSCGVALKIPRPSRGYYAAPTQSELDQAELYGVPVSEGTHRGELKIALARAREDPHRRPSEDKLKAMYQKQAARRQDEEAQRIADLERRIAAAGASGEPIGELLIEHRRALEGREHRLALERQLAEAAEKERRREAREEARLRREYIEPEFGARGDYGEWYHKPTREQFDAIYGWLDTNRPGWSDRSGRAEVASAIDLLFPELRR